MTEPREAWVTEIVCKNGMMFLARGSREEIEQALRSADNSRNPFVELTLFSQKDETATVYSVRPEDVFMVGNDRPERDFDPIDTVKDKEGNEVQLWFKGDPTVRH